jgi:hypothetical protein
MELTVRQSLSGAERGDLGILPYLSYPLTKSGKTEEAEQSSSRTLPNLES